MKPEQKKILILATIAGILGVGLCAYFYFMLIKPDIQKAQSAYAKAGEEKENYKKELQRIADFQAILETEEYKDIKSRVAELEKRLPKTQQADQFYNALTDALLVTGVTNNLLEKQPIDDKLSIRYEEIPYKLRAQSRYHQFGQFLNIIEENPERYMRVKTMTIGNSGDPNIHPINIEVATFRFISRN